jgi:hypothetical protein
MVMPRIPNTAERRLKISIILVFTVISLMRAALHRQYILNGKRKL